MAVSKLLKVIVDFSVNDEVYYIKNKGEMMKELSYDGEIDMFLESNVFLAGTIKKLGDQHWRKILTEACKDADVTFVNSKRDLNDIEVDEDYESITEWEDCALEVANIAVFYFNSAEDDGELLLSQLSDTLEIEDICDDCCFIICINNNHENKSAIESVCNKGDCTVVYSTDELVSSLKQAIDSLLD